MAKSWENDRVQLVGKLANLFFSYGRARKLIISWAEVKVSNIRNFQTKE